MMQSPSQYSVCFGLSPVSKDGWQQSKLRDLEGIGQIHGLLAVRLRIAAELNELDQSSVTGRTQLRRSF